MTNLQFDNYLPSIGSRSRRHRYYFGTISQTTIAYIKEDSQLPFIMKNNEGNLGVSINRQWRTRATVKKIMGVADTAVMPIPLFIGSEWYFVGKGFIARVINEEKDKIELDVLFLACRPTSIRYTELHIKDITFYISRRIFTEPSFSKIKDVVEKFMETHQGDIIITSDIDRVVGHTIQYPAFSTIKSKNEYLSKLTDFCTENIRKSL